VNLKPLTNLVGRQVLHVRKHSPVILFSAGVVGIVGTVVLASRATLKLEEVLEETQNKLELVNNVQHERYSEDDRTKDKIILYVQGAGRVARLYGPAVVLGSLSIAALTGSHVILTKRNGALMAAYAVLDRGFREYRQRVIEKFGVEKDKEFRYGGEEREIIVEGKEGHKVKTVHDTIPGNPSIYARCFDKTCNSWSPVASYNQVYLRCQQNWANDMLRARGHLFLNEVYDMLHMPRSKEGSIVGWVVDGDGDGYVDFGIFKNDLFEASRFIRGDNDAVWLDFNVDGIIYDKI